MESKRSFLCEKLFFVSDIFKWDLTNWELEIKESHDFETPLNFKSDLTGNLESISMMISIGKFGICIWSLVIEVLISLLVAINGFRIWRMLSQLTHKWSKWQAANNVFYFNVPMVNSEKFCMSHTTTNVVRHRI